MFVNIENKYRCKLRLFTFSKHISKGCFIGKCCIKDCQTKPNQIQNDMFILQRYISGSAATENELYLYYKVGHCPETI